MNENLQVSRKEKKIIDNEFNMYFNKYNKKITNYIYKLVKNFETSEEIAQNVFIKFYKNLSKLKKDNLQAWLYKVAHNDTISHLKKNSTITISLENQFVEPFTQNTPQMIIDQKKEAESIYNIMMKLPKSQRTTILLKYVKGYSYQEIAKTMDISYEAVKSLIYRGRQNFIKYYREVKEDEM